jgi:hypothetical protein
MHHVVCRGPCRIRNSSHADNLSSLSARVLQQFSVAPPPSAGISWYKLLPYRRMLLHDQHWLMHSHHNEPSSTRAHRQFLEVKVVMAERVDLEDLLRVQERWMPTFLRAPSFLGAALVILPVLIVRQVRECTYSLHSLQDLTCVHIHTHGTDVHIHTHCITLQYVLSICKSGMHGMVHQPSLSITSCVAFDFCSWWASSLIRCAQDLSCMAQ